MLNTKAKREIPAGNPRAALLRLFRCMTRWRGPFTVMVFLLILSLGCDLVTPLFIESAIDTIMAGRGVIVSFSALTRSVAAFVLIAAAGSVLECILGRICARVTLNMARQLRQDSFESLMSASVSSFEGMLQGDLMSRIMNDTEMAAGAFTETFRELACSMVMLTGCAVIMIFKSPFLAFISIGFSIFSVVVMGFLSGLVFPVLSEQQAALGRLNAHVEESMKSFQTCKAVGRMDENIRRMDELSRDYCSWKIRSGRLEYLMGPVMLLMGNLSFLLTLFFGIRSVLSGSITVGAMQAFIMYSRLFMEPVNALGEYFVRAQNALAGAERVFSLIDRKTESEELAQAARDTLRSSGKAADPEDYLFFDSVRFAYRRNFPVLKGVTLRIRKGEKLALIGKTGEGKTTMASLLLLLYPGYSGSILLEGHELRELDISGLRSRIAFVSQEPQVLNGTVYENLTYGCEGAGRQDVEKLLHELGMASMFSRFPGGLDTEIQSVGRNMSHGQLQMICLARALLRGASILVFDEATSSLDPDTEELINRGMEKAMKGKTCIIIAHRISSVRDADHIAVLSDGIISEYGTHDSLIESRGLYYTLYKTQFSGKEI